MSPGPESTYDPSGKFQLVRAGDLLLPAECANCKNPSHSGGYVDTKIELDFYGILYFCEDCAFELTTVFPAAPYHVMRNRILSLEEEVVAKDALLATLERALDGLTAARLVDRDVSIVGGVIIGADVPAGEDADSVAALLSTEPRDNDSVVTEPVTSDDSGKPANTKRRNQPVALLPD